VSQTVYSKERKFIYEKFYFLFLLLGDFFAVTLGIISFPEIRRQSVLL
jgi:hypothetical protein